MNTAQAITETFASEYLLNRAKVRELKKGNIAKKYQKNDDGSYTVEWAKLERPSTTMLKSVVQRSQPRNAMKAVRYGALYNMSPAMMAKTYREATGR